MMYEMHCRQCLHMLGEEYGYVHKWLDRFFNPATMSWGHRDQCHHTEGVEEVRIRWGGGAALAAAMHIAADFPDIDHIPSKDEVKALTRGWKPRKMSLEQWLGPAAKGLEDDDAID